MCETSVSGGHHKWCGIYIDEVDQLKGALASKSWGGWGVANFWMMWEAPDQREPTMEGFELAEIRCNFRQNQPSKANFQGQLW